MADINYYPDCWKDFCKLSKENSAKRPKVWNQFAARYRLAASFQSADFMRLSEKAKLGYSSAIQLMLAYSAFEHCCRAAYLDPNKVEIIPYESSTNRSISRAIKQHLLKFESLYFSEDFKLSKLLSVKVKNYAVGKSDNRQPVCAMFRHSFAHGYWNVNSTNAISRSTREMLNFLSRELLFKCDELLRKEVENF